MLCPAVDSETSDADSYSGKHVVFGEVVSGMEVIKAVEKLGTRDGKVLGDKKIIVKSCGKA